MSTDRDVTRIVRSWLRTDEHESADRVLDVVLGRLDTTPQRRPLWRAWRDFLVNNSIRFAAAGTFALVVAAVAFALYFSRPAVTPGGTPTPFASQSAPTEPATQPTIQTPSEPLPAAWPLAGVIEPAGTLSAATQIPTAVALDDGRVLVITGDVNNGVSQAEIWDPDLGTFAPAGPMARQREMPRAVLLADGRVLLIGSDMSRDGSEPTAEIFDPATGIFRLTASPPRTIDGSAVLLADGRVLVSGGAATLDPDEAGLRPNTAMAEIFDPATNAFEPTGDMVRPQINHRLVLLRDGRVLVVDGFADPAAWVPQQVVEIFDPLSGRFELATRPGLGIGGAHPSARLGDGSLVILRQPGWGGYPDFPQPMTVVIYDPESGMQTEGPILQPKDTVVYDVRAVMSLTDRRLLLFGFDKRSYQQGPSGILDRGWLGVLDLDTGVLSEIGTRDSWGTAVSLSTGRVLLIGGMTQSECRAYPPTEPPEMVPCIVASTAVDVLR